MTMLRLALERQAQWLVFEPNTAELRAGPDRRRDRSCCATCTARAPSPARTEEESFFVRCDDSAQPGRGPRRRAGWSPRSASPRRQPLEYLVLRIAQDAEGGLAWRTEPWPRSCRRAGADLPVPGPADPQRGRADAAAPPDLAFAKRRRCSGATSRQPSRRRSAPRLPRRPWPAASSATSSATAASRSAAGSSWRPTPKEYLEGGRNDGFRRVGRVKLVPIVLKRGMFVAQPRAARRPTPRSGTGCTGMVSGRLPLPRYDGAVEVLRPGRTSRGSSPSWTFDRGLPSKVTGPSLNAKTGEIAVEELHIAPRGPAAGEHGGHDRRWPTRPCSACDTASRPGKNKPANGRGPTGPTLAVQFNPTSLKISRTNNIDRGGVDHQDPDGARTRRRSRPR